jgi:hypothetical protein
MTPQQQAAALKAKIDLAAVQAAEVAAQRSTTPAAGKIPVAGEDGKLADGWIPDDSGGGRPARIPHSVGVNEVNWTGNWRVVKRWNMTDFYDDDFVLPICRVTCGRVADGEWKVRVTAVGIGGAPDKTWDVTMAAGELVGHTDILETVRLDSYHDFNISVMLSGDVGDDNPQDVDVELISYAV